MTMFSAKDILATASALVTNDRAVDYGSAKETHQMIADLWSAYLGVAVSAPDVAQMMCLLKIARSKRGTFKADTFIDQAGYAAIAGEISQNNT